MKHSAIRQSAIGNRQSSGFTLVELLTVVAIIALLAGLVVGVSGYATRKSAISRAEADIERIKIGLEEYRATYGLYPGNSTETDSRNLARALWFKPQNEGRKPFLVMKGWTDPTSQNYTIIDPWGNEYRYLHRPASPYADHNNFKFGYDLWSLGPDALDPADDIKNWGGN